MREPVVSDRVPFDDRAEMRRERYGGATVARFGLDVTWPPGEEARPECVGPIT